MRKLLFGLAALPFLAGGIASATDRLTDAQMDRISAGAIGDLGCSTCVVSKWTSVSNSGPTGTTSTTTSTTTTGSGAGLPLSLLLLELGRNPHPMLP